jgi:hypothetical protein
MVRFLAVLLLIGTLLLMGAGLFHPILPLTGPADLALINAMPHWRTLHLLLLYATGLVVVGIWARWLSANALERPALAVAFGVAGIGQTLNGINIAFMTGAGTWFASQFAPGAPVAEIYQATHLFAVTTGRLGGFLVALGAAIIALATRAGGQDPRWLIAIAGLAAVGGLVGNILAPPGHPLMLASIGILAVWQLITALRLLRPATG